MSPTRPGKFTPSPSSNPPENPVERRPDGDHPSIRDCMDSQDPWRQGRIPVEHPRTTAQRSPSPCPERLWYNDPCNYIG